MSTEASRARGAAAALFMVDGAMTGNLVPRFPDAVLVVLLSRALSDGAR